MNIKRIRCGEPMMKLDFGCGKNTREGFEGVDSREFGQLHVVDLTGPWPWADESVDEAFSSHFVEHLDADQRVHFCNELFRVLKPGSSCQIIVPHWASCRAYGDLTHKWPPVSEFWFYYLSTQWREQNAPHNDAYKCNFEVSWGYNYHPDIISRNETFVREAAQWKKEAIMDIVANFKKPDAR